MSNAAHTHPQAPSFREVLDGIAEDQRKAKLVPLSEDEAAELADEVVSEVRQSSDKS